MIILDVKVAKGVYFCELKLEADGLIARHTSKLICLE